MNKLCVLACLLISLAATAQTAPKVVFVGELFTPEWQTAPQFTANKNWIGAGLPTPVPYDDSTVVLQDFQANVINQHPAFVHIMTGFGDIAEIKDSTPLPMVLQQQWEEDVTSMVAMAQKANIKVILGNLPASAPPEIRMDGVRVMNAWLDQFGRAKNIPVVNYHDALCQCVGSTLAYDTFTPAYGTISYPDFPGGTQMTPTAAGLALITQMAQTAIATYGLTIKSGNLSDVLIPDFNTNFTDDGTEPTINVNTVVTSSLILFTPQAKWSDGVVRPMLSQNFDGMQGIWISSNPAVMYVNQQGQALAYGPGKATISFKSASGVPFSPWVMTVYAGNTEYY
jgi:hypothetical protein